MEQINKKSKICLMAAGITSRGIHREKNEDNYQLCSYYKADSGTDYDSYVYESRSGQRYQVFAIFDGMGGGKNGERASIYAAREMKNGYMMLELQSDISEEAASWVIKSFLQSANNRVVRTSEDTLGTTAVVGLFDTRENQIKLFWSGDSRAYLYREKNVFQLTKDESVGEVRFENGDYGKDSFQYQKDRNKLIRYVGYDKSEYAFQPQESSWISIKEGDIFILVTDGVWEKLSGSQIRNIICKAEENAVLSCEGLIKGAIQRCASDDMSAVVIKVCGNDFQKWRC